MLKEKGVDVRVVLRCRPFTEEESIIHEPPAVTCTEDKVAVSPDDSPRVFTTKKASGLEEVFTFNKVFGPLAPQIDIFKAVVPIINEVFEGFNCSIMSYGYMNSGKSYTMNGQYERSKIGCNGELPQKAGVIPRAVKHIFDKLERQTAKCTVKVTFLELYSEEITDLLAPEEISRIPVEDRQKKQLLLVEDGKGCALVKGLKEEIVTSAGQVFDLLERGSAKRHTAETLLNKRSRWSHTLLSITIHTVEATPDGEGIIECGTLNLVDLAGAREGHTSEVGVINKSFFTLGQVISALAKHLKSIPYRHSMLTRLLRDSLGGGTKTCIIATVSPSVQCREETLKTIKFAYMAMTVNNVPKVNGRFSQLALKRSMDNVFSNDLILFKILCYVDNCPSMAFARTVRKNWCSTLHCIEQRGGLIGPPICYSLVFLAKALLTRELESLLLEGEKAGDGLRRLAHVMLQKKLRQTLLAIDRLPGFKKPSVNVAQAKLQLQAPPTVNVLECCLLLVE
ncbi:kinesin-like protein KIN-5C [Rhododendron vialii]|uniref:kinesin-like protein KIN-5C n=1 Tax=Rhododendron vialii TaxID=182163 RepID=UPI0026603863|nr:kinesin-like protein KIN-5C [Rhododendron vialii]